MAVTPVALPPGVLSVHVLPADHHDGPWDHIVTPPGLKERLLNHALLTLLHGPGVGHDGRPATRAHHLVGPAGNR